MRPLRPLSVLVVDGLPDSVRLTVGLLVAHGYRATGATGEREAMAAAAADPPDLALIDLGLPGAGGCELARRLAEMFPGRPPVVIAVVVSGGEAGEARVPPTGFHMCLEKPVPTAELLRVVRICERAVACCDGPDDRTTVQRA